MKFQTIIFTIFLGCFLLVGCESPPEETNEKIDKTVETTKDLLDVLGSKAKEIVSDKELQNKLKDILKDVEGESKELEKILKEKGADWKEKIEEIKNDPKFKEKLKDLGGDAKEVLKKLEDLANELDKDKKEK